MQNLQCLFFFLTDRVTLQHVSTSDCRTFTINGPDRATHAVFLLMYTCTCAALGHTAGGGRRDSSAIGEVKAECVHNMTPQSK